MKNTYYITRDESGITRARVGKVFHYFSPRGRRIVNETILARIKILRIPPAYQKVWICKSVKGHIQAYGYDDKGRKQYIYHAKWKEKQEKNKFDHLLAFGKSLAKVRRKVNKHLALTKLTKNKVIAVVVKLLDKTSIRVGSPQYDSYGLLTLRKKHIKIRGAIIYLDFEGKSKQNWHLEVYNKKLADLIKRFEKNPGYTLFKYFDVKNNVHTLKVADVNAYLKTISGVDITAKEFRTWNGSALFLHHMLKFKDHSPAIVAICIDKVAKVLGNTAAVCKNSYIHPLLLKVNYKNLSENFKSTQFNKNSSMSLDEMQLLFLLKKY